MSILLKNITLIAPNSDFHLKQHHVFIDANKAEIATKEHSASTVIDGTGKYISVGWCDMLSFCGEPGEEWKETLDSLGNAAAAGGYTQIASICGKDPAPYRASQIRAIQNWKHSKVEIFPLAFPTEKGEAKEISEMYDLYQNGAIGFFNGEIPITDLSLISKIFEYSKNYNWPIIFWPYQPKLAAGAYVHEGKSAVYNGLKGIPEIAEIQMVQAILEIANWLNVPVHLTRISCADSIELITKSKLINNKITCSIPIYNLVFNETSIETFDENYKLQPPLRSEENRLKLIQQVKDGKVDAIITNHVPQDIDSKRIEFDLAEYGSISIQHAFSILNKELDLKNNLHLLNNLLIENPRKILNLEHLDFFAAQNYTIFDMDTEYSVIESDIQSLSKNSPCIGSTLRGKVWGTIAKNNWHANNMKLSLAQ